MSGEAEVPISVDAWVGRLWNISCHLCFPLLPDPPDPTCRSVWEWVGKGRSGECLDRPISSSWSLLVQKYFPSIQQDAFRIPQEGKKKKKDKKKKKVRDLGHKQKHNPKWWLHGRNVHCTVYRLEWLWGVHMSIILKRSRLLWKYARTFSNLSFRCKTPSFLLGGFKHGFQICMDEHVRFGVGSRLTIYISETGTSSRTAVLLVRS